MHESTLGRSYPNLKHETTVWCHVEAVGCHVEGRGCLRRWIFVTYLVMKIQGSKQGTPRDTPRGHVSPSPYTHRL